MVVLPFHLVNGSAKLLVLTNCESRIIALHQRVSNLSDAWRCMSIWWSHWEFWYLIPSPDCWKIGLLQPPLVLPPFCVALSEGTKVDDVDLGHGCFHGVVHAGTVVLAELTVFTLEQAATPTQERVVMQCDKMTLTQCQFKQFITKSQDSCNVLNMQICQSKIEQTLKSKHYSNLQFTTFFMNS